MEAETVGSTPTARLLLHVVLNAMIALTLCGMRCESVGVTVLHALPAGTHCPSLVMKECSVGAAAVLIAVAAALNVVLAAAAVLSVVAVVAACVLETGLLPGSLLPAARWCCPLPHPLLNAGGSSDSEAGCAALK